MYISYLKTKSLAVTGSPSLHVTSSRSFMVRVKPSSLIPPFSVEGISAAISGMGLLSGSNDQRLLSQNCVVMVENHCVAYRGLNVVGCCTKVTIAIPAAAGASVGASVAGASVAAGSGSVATGASVAAGGCVAAAPPQALSTRAVITRTNNSFCFISSPLVGFWLLHS